MLVECPRCHFRQPQDQYCASCGVDMLAYKPKEEPFLTKLVKSGTFQFMMVVLLGIGVTWFVVRSDRPQQWIQKINRFASVSPNPKSKTEAGIAEDQQEFEAPPAAANAWSARSANAPTPQGAAAMTAESGAAATAAPPPATAAARAGSVSGTQAVSATAKVRVQMVEIDHDYLANLTNERLNGNVSTLSGDISIFRSFPDVKLDSSNYKVLKTDVMNFSASEKNNSVSAGNNARWIRFTASVLDIRDATKFFDAYFIKNHPNDTQQIPVDLTLSPGEKYILSGTGLLTYFDVEQDLANQVPFTIFKSADYRNQKTTFAIIIDLQ